MQSLDGRQKEMDSFCIDPSEFTKTNLHAIKIFRGMTVPISSFPTLYGQLTVLNPLNPELNPI